MKEGGYFTEGSERSEPNPNLNPNLTHTVCAWAHSRCGPTAMKKSGPPPMRHTIPLSTNGALHSTPPTLELEVDARAAV